MPSCGSLLLWLPSCEITLPASAVIMVLYAAPGRKDLKQNHLLVWSKVSNDGLLVVAQNALRLPESLHVHYRS